MLQLHLSVYHPALFHILKNCILSFRRLRQLALVPAGCEAQYSHFCCACLFQGFCAVFCRCSRRIYVVHEHDSSAVYGCASRFSHFESVFEISASLSRVEPVHRSGVSRPLYSVSAAGHTEPLCCKLCKQRCLVISAFFLLLFKR